MAGWGVYVSKEICCSPNVAFQLRSVSGCSRTLPKNEGAPSSPHTNIFVASLRSCLALRFDVLDQKTLEGSKTRVDAFLFTNLLLLSDMQEGCTPEPVLASAGP
eukprot:1158755-Pelagomonas_calceolata.AAC.5